MSPRARVKKQKQQTATFGAMSCQHDGAPNKSAARRTFCEPLDFYRYSEARAVAVQQVGLRYRCVPAPRNDRQLQQVTSTMLEEHRGAFTVPNSWEIATGSL